MSIKAARGTKRACQSCGSKFYDLNRDPITCPICNAVFMDHDAKPKAVVAGNADDDDDDDDVLASSKGDVEVVSLEEVAADENEDIPDLEDDDLSVDDDEDLGGDDEDFIAVEDDDEGDDVTGIVGGSREDEDEA